MSVITSEVSRRPLAGVGSIRTRRRDGGSASALVVGIEDLGGEHGVGIGLNDNVGARLGPEAGSRGDHHVTAFHQRLWSGSSLAG